MQKIVLATQDDAKILADLCACTKGASKWSEGNFQTEILQKCAKIFVLKEGQNIIAFCCTRVAMDFAEITNIAVCQKYQRQGFGHSFLSEVLKILRGESVKEISLEVSEKNIFAINFYKTFNFKTVNIRKNFYNKGEDAFLMRLIL